MPIIPKLRIQNTIYIKENNIAHVVLPSPNLSTHHKLNQLMTSCGLLKEKAHKNLALPSNIFFQKILVHVRFLIF